MWKMYFIFKINIDNISYLERYASISRMLYKILSDIPILQILLS